MSENYFDEHGNYMNVENLTLAEIYKRGYQDGMHLKKMIESGYACTVYRDSPRERAKEAAKKNDD